MKKILIENSVKNLMVILILAFVYSDIYSFLQNSVVVSDKGAAGSMLVAVSILAVTACFGNFSFTYEKINMNKVSLRLLGHITTALLMLLIGVSLEISSVLVGFIVGDFVILKISWLVLYIASIGYDYWDLLKVAK
jgi:hypothetical protein